jgi:hypothetical protein
MKNESIGKILEELEKTRQFLVKFQASGKIPDIERDIVLGKLRNMYEFIQLIQPEEVERPVEVINIEPQQPKAQTSVMPEPEPKVIEFDQPKEAVKEVVNETVKEELIPEPEPEPVLEPQPQQESQQESQPIPTPEPHHKPARTEILAEKFQSPSFLNETLAKYQDVTDLSKKMQSQPIKDIFSAINLNDKFLFIKELFNNDAALYQSTIEKLNNAANFNDAVRYLDGNFTWDFSETLVQNFLELVRRRFL